MNVTANVGKKLNNEPFYASWSVPFLNQN